MQQIDYGHYQVLRKEWIRAQGKRGLGQFGVGAEGGLLDGLVGHAISCTSQPVKCPPATSSITAVSKRGMSLLTASMGPINGGLEIACTSGLSSICLGWPQALLRRLGDLSCVPWRQGTIAAPAGQGLSIEMGDCGELTSQPKHSQNYPSLPKTTQAYPWLTQDYPNLSKATSTAHILLCPHLSYWLSLWEAEIGGKQGVQQEDARWDSSPMSTPCVVSTLQVMECSPFLGSDYPVLGDFCDLQYQMDRAGGRLGERCLQYSFTLLIYMRERAVLMHATAHRLSSFQQQAGRQERETESYPLPYLSPSLRQRQWLLQSLLF